MADVRRPGGNPNNNGRAAGGQTRSTASGGQGQRVVSGQNRSTASGRQTRSTASGGHGRKAAGGRQSSGNVQGRSTAGSYRSSGQRMTRAQKRRRYNIRRYSILAGLALFGIAIVVVLVLLLSALIRHFGGSDSAQQAAASAAAAESVVQTTEAGENAAEASPSASPVQPVSVTLMAVGDNLIHDTIYQFGQQEDGTYDFTEIYRYVQDDIESADLACIQQETIFVSDSSEYSNYPTFGTPSEMADSLTAVGFDVVCHASNHALDKGMTGITDTLEKWKEHPEVTPLGIHDSQEDYDTIRVVEKNGIQIALLDYTYGLNGFVPEEDYEVDLMDEDHKARVQSQIEEAKGMSDIVVVFMHDGTENQFTPDDDQLSWAQFFADEGVGLVIGTHPHVIEPTDVLTGVNGNTMPVFYSLGNFLSSQSDAQNMVGAIANVTITKDSSGTYVSDYSVEPVCTLITNEGTVGYGYAFHIYHLEDYTDELAAKHLRSGCGVDALWSIWNNVFEGDAAWKGTDSTDSAAAADTDDSAEPAGTADPGTTTDTTATGTADTAAAAATPIAGTAAVIALHSTALTRAA